MAKILKNNAIKLGEGTLDSSAFEIKKYNLTLRDGATAVHAIGAYKVGDLVFLYGRINKAGTGLILDIPSAITPSSNYTQSSAENREVAIRNFGQIYVYSAGSTVSLNGIMYKV